MHCLLIHQAYAGPEDPGGTRHYELARKLEEQGHRFTVVTGTVNYLTGTPRTDSVNEGRRGHDSPRVVTAWVPATIHRGFVWRVLAFLAFSVSSLFSSLRVRDVDVVIGTTPPIFQAGTAWLVAFLKRVPFALEVRDLWPEFAIDMGVLKNPVLIRLARWLEAFLYRHANVIVVNSPAYREYLLKRGIGEKKVHVVPNGVDIQMFDPDADGSAERRRLGFDEHDFIATYTGALGMANDIGTILRAAELLREHEDIQFLLVGDGKERSNLEAQATDAGLSNITFTGSVPKSAIPAVLAASDACIATLMPIPMFTTTYPNKVFDYMAAARPTVLAIDGVIREVVEAAGGGIFVPPGSPEALASAVRTLAEDRVTAREMGQRAREYVARNFDRAEQAGRFGEILQTVVQDERV